MCCYTGCRGEGGGIGYEQLTSGTTRFRRRRLRFVLIVVPLPSPHITSPSITSVMAEFDDDPPPSSNIRKLKQCYYELLDIDMDATEDEIRQAYKYQALRWHPDKNVSDPDAAAAMFREVQQAYSVLMDVKKRRWYDKFRDKILLGNEEIIDDKSIDMEDFMSSACYEGYSDDDTGFYTVYKKVFEELMREELPYEDEDDVTPPGFGSSSSDYEDVHKFYSHWSSFCTKKTFDHLMKYDVLEAPNRRTVRAMEKENMKIRELAKKERNEDVRRLVSFIRKKDKRVIRRKNELKVINENNRKKTEEERRKVIESRMKDLGESKDQAESEWTSMKTLERSLHALERRYDRDEQGAKEKERKKNGTTANEEDDDEILILSDEDDDEDGENGETKSKDSDNDKDEEAVDPGNMFCIACDKRFKSRPAFDNHSKSKKHVQNVNALRNALLEDESLMS